MTKQFVKTTGCIGCLLLLLSCSATERKRIKTAVQSNDPEKALIAAVKQNVKDKGEAYQQAPEQIIADVKSIARLFDDLETLVKVIWGKEDADLPSNKKYVKYTNDYQSRAEVDFVKGLVTIETIAKDAPLEQLTKAIEITLLTSDNPSETDIFSDKTPTLSSKPFLYQQVIDHDNQPIAYQWRANRFAQYLVANQLKSRTLGQRKSRYVEIPMVGSHSELRKQQYAEYVFSAANQYGIKPQLIYAIIETESSFNPFAVSRSNAYGLMQIIPASAGKDVYEKVLKKPGMPSRNVLFQAKDNIHIGAAYLHILQDMYLVKINNSQSRQFAMISAYNGGAGNVFRTFSSQRDRAVSIINQLSANKIYQKLTTAHPRAESRRYLEKVSKAQLKY